MNPVNRKHKCCVCSTAFTVTSLIHMFPALLLLWDVVIKICEIFLGEITDKLSVADPFEFTHDWCTWKDDATKM